MQPVSLPTRSFIRSVKRDSKASWLSDISHRHWYTGTGEENIRFTVFDSCSDRTAVFHNGFGILDDRLDTVVHPSNYPSSLAIGSQSPLSQRHTTLLEQTHPIQDLLLPFGQVLHGILELRHSRAQLPHNLDFGRVTRAVRARRRGLLGSMARLGEGRTRRSPSRHVRVRVSHMCECQVGRVMRVRERTAIGYIHVRVRHGTRGRTGVAGGEGEVGAWVGYEGVSRSGHVGLTRLWKIDTAKSVRFIRFNHRMEVESRSLLLGMLAKFVLVLLHALVWSGGLATRRGVLFR